jgi:methionyl-tRNA formyltransferase
MKILFIGCVQFSYRTLKHLLNMKEADIVGVITRRESSFNADFQSLEPLALEAGIPCFIAEGNNQDTMVEWLKVIEPDVVYCFGWSYLLKKEILNMPRLGVIGYHPAALPKNRGRHPIIWALALGLQETGSSFFFMDEGADSGDILNQRIITITSTDDSATLYRRLMTNAVEQITEFTIQLATGKYVRTKQDHSKANYWRKRTKRDGQIDWRMSARSIHNLVRALTHPYPGAHCVYYAEEVMVWKTAVFDSCIGDVINHEFGKVLEADQSGIIVKCGEGVLKLLDHEFAKMPERGSYL